MGQILRVGADKPYQTLTAALTALGTITDTGVNEILVDAGFTVSEDLNSNGLLVNSDASTATCNIRGDGGRFNYVVPGIASECVILNTQGLSMSRFNALNESNKSFGIMYKNNNYFSDYTLNSTVVSANTIAGGFGATGQYLEDGEHLGLITNASNGIATVRRCSFLGQSYGIRGADFVEDCAVFGSIYSDDINAGATVITSATSDETGSVGFVNLVATDHFIDIALSAALKPASILVGAGTSQFSIGSDQLTGFIAKPVLTNINVNTIGLTTAKINITTDTAEGPLSWVATTNGTPPTPEQIEAGLDADDVAGVYVISYVMSEAVEIIFNIEDMATFTDYYVHVVHRKSTGQVSDVFTTPAFKTLDIVRPIVSGITVVNQTGAVTLTGTNFLATAGSVSIDGKPQTDITSWTDTQIVFNVDMTDRKFGSYEMFIVGNNAVSSRVSNVNVIPVAGKTAVNILSSFGDARSLDLNMGEVSVAGDQMEVDLLTDIGNPITLRDNLAFMISGGGAALQTFDYRRFHSGIWSSLRMASIQGQLAVPAPNSAPVISSLTLEATVGQDLVVDFGATDADSDTLAYTVTGTGAANYIETTPGIGTFNSSVEGTEVLNVSVDDGNGGVTAATFTINISAVVATPNPVITVQPVAKSIDEGGNTSFTLTATNATSYIWYEDEAVMVGETTNTINLMAVPLSASGKTYRAEAVGTTTVSSDTVVLTVNAVIVPVTIDTQPVDMSVDEGTGVVLTVGASNADSYLWHENGIALNSEITSSLDLGMVALADSGKTYKVDAIGDTTVTSTTVTLTVNAVIVPVVITVQPTAKTVTEGDNTSFTLTATNASSYIWYEDDVVMPGEVTNTLSLSNVTLAMTGYAYRADAIGDTTVSSDIVFLTVNAKPVSVDTIGRSLVVNPENGTSGMVPHGTATANISNLVERMHVADGIGYTIGSHQVTPGNAILTTLGDQEVLDFIAASNADAILIAGRTEAVGQQTPDWLTAAGQAADAIKTNGAEIIWYQGWLKQDNWNDVTSGYVVDNWKAVQVANGGTIVQTFEALDYIRKHPEYGPLYFAPIGMGYDLTSPSILWADNTHGNFPMYYIAAGCLYRAMTGKLTSSASYVPPSDYNMDAAFIRACNEAIDNAQIEVMPGVTLEPYIAGVTEYWAAANVVSVSPPPAGETVNFLNLGENSGVNTDPFSRNLLSSTGNSSTVMFNLPEPVNWSGKGGTPILNANANWIANAGYLPDVLMRHLDSTYNVSRQETSFSGLTPNQNYTLKYSGCRDGSAKQRTVALTFGDKPTEIFEASYNNGIDKVNTSSGLTIVARANASGIIPLIIEAPASGDGGGSYVHFSGFILSKSNATSNQLPIIEDQVVETTEGEDIVITLGDTTDPEGESVTYAITGTSDYIAGPGSNQITFTTSVVDAHIFTATASDGKEEVSAQITVNVIAKPLSQVTSNVTQNISKTISLGPVQNELMQTLTYSINPADYTVTGNMVEIISPTGGSKSYQILADDGQGGGAEVIGQLTVNTQSTQDEISKMDMVGWSLIENTDNGNVSITPHGSHTGCIPELVEQMAVADGLTQTVGAYIRPGQNAMEGLSEQATLDFINASTAQAILLSGYSDSIRQATPTWSAEAKVAADAVKAKGKQLVWYQGWIDLSIWTPTNTANVIANFEQLKIDNGGIIIRTHEALEFMRVNHPSYFTPVGTGNNNEPATQLFADAIHGTFAMYYMAAACVYRAMTGKLTSSRNYVFPTLYNGIDPAFLDALNEAVDKTQDDVLDGITLSAYGTDYTEIWASAGVNKAVQSPNGEAVNYLNLGAGGTGGPGTISSLDNVGGSATAIKLETVASMYGGSDAVATKVGENTGYLPDVLMASVDYDNALPYVSKFTGCTPGIEYTLKLTGSRTGSGTRKTEVRFGEIANTASFDATENRDLGLTISAIADSNGEIVFEFVTPATEGNGWAYMTGFILTSGVKNIKYLDDIVSNTVEVN